MTPDLPPVTQTLRRLSEVGLGTWVRPIMLLLVQLDGIEELLDDNKAPAYEISDAVERALSCEPRMRSNALFASLAQLSALRVQASAMDRLDRWDPMTEPFLDFKRRHDGRLNLWTEERSAIDRTRLVTWLEQWL